MATLGVSRVRAVRLSLGTCYFTFGGLKWVLFIVMKVLKKSRFRPNWMTLLVLIWARGCDVVGE